MCIWERERKSIYSGGNHKKNSWKTQSKESWKIEGSATDFMSPTAELIFNSSLVFNAIWLLLASFQTTLLAVAVEFCQQPNYQFIVSSE